MGKDWYPNCWLNQEWRLNHLYYILSKDKGIIRFKMNWAQQQLFKTLHNRNNILKARQLGMSTFTSIFILDMCLHNANFQAGIIDKGLDDAKEKLKKIKLAYQLLKNPPDRTIDDPVEDAEDRENIAMWGKALIETIERDGEVDPQTERMTFPNRSEIRIGTSLRGGTLNFLHVSEFGWVANNNPVRAQEIESGGFEAVPADGCIVIESTHEGAKTGANYRILKAAMENIGKHHSAHDFKFFFFPWYNQGEYRIDSSEPLGETEDDDYFRTLARQGVELDDAQKRWYVKKHKVLGYRMKTEYPTTPEEAFMGEQDGSIYAKYIAQARAEGRMAVETEADAYKPLYVSWDIGMKDNMCMWLIQPQAYGKFLALDYYSCSGKALPHFLTICQQWEREHGQLITLHLLPHDASHRDPSTGLSFDMRFYEAGIPAVVIPKTNDVWKGIYAVRDLLKSFSFHVRCSLPRVVDGEEITSGVDSLESYRKATIGGNGVIRETPLHDISSHGADAFRMFAEALSAGYVNRDKAVSKEKREPVSLWGKNSTSSGEKRGVCKGVPAYW